ncbi:MAG: hypothetical protein DRI57_08960, partial [Deltaproteobacteria bacterium]
ILKAIRKIGEKSPDTARKIRFRQMGYTDLDYDINAFTAENDLHENYTDLGPLPFDECLRNMGRADILVIIQQDTKTQVPSKIYEYMYLKKPILTVAQKDGALGKMIEKYQFGDIFEPHDVNGLADYLSRKVSDKEKNGTLETVYKNSEIFDVRNITKELEKILLS